MQISRTKLRGYEVNVIFTGPTYYFMNNYYGCVAMAIRNHYDSLNHETSFNLFVGNRHCLGGSFTNSTVREFAKKVIKKSECRFLEKTVKYDEYDEDLANIQLNLEHIILK